MGPSFQKVALWLLAAIITEAWAKAQISRNRIDPGWGEKRENLSPGPCPACTPPPPTPGALPEQGPHGSQGGRPCPTSPEAAQGGQRMGQDRDNQCRCSRFLEQRKLSLQGQARVRCPCSELRAALGHYQSWVEAPPRAGGPSLTCKEFITPLASTAIFPATDLTPCLNCAMSAVGNTLPREPLPKQAREQWGELGPAGSPPVPHS